MQKRAVLILLAFVSVLLAGLLYRYAAAATQPAESVRKKLGDPTVAVLLGATEVEVARIDPSVSLPSGENAIGSHRITTPKKRLGKGFATRLAALLLQEKTYQGSGMKCFTPRVAYRLWKGKESVDVSVCFSCLNLYVDYEGKHGPFHRAGAPFSLVYKDLLRLTKEALPHDKEIQRLDENRQMPASHRN